MQSRNAIPSVLHDGKDERHVARSRRGSYDEKVLGQGRKFLIDVQDTQKRLLAQEDTDNNFQITIHDAGPKVFSLGSVNSSGYRKHEIRGCYMISNLLQELALADQYGRKYIVLDEKRLNENPVERLSRLIKYHFWDGLTRRIDANGLELSGGDTKNRTNDQQPRIYIPYRDDFAYEYFKEVARIKPHLNLDVVKLPEYITPRYVKSIDCHPGLLSLGLRKTLDPKSGALVVRGVPYTVPGGRFNEFYGWDSYFEALGLLCDGRNELARAMVDNFCYEIEHYGKILNANRSYYLTRSQPPFLTDMIIEVSKAITKKIENCEFQDTRQSPYVITSLKGLNLWRYQGVRAAIKELFSVWLSFPRLDTTTWLSKYYTDGIGMPIETESQHFDHILQPYADKYSLDLETFKQHYLDEKVFEPELDEYFVHDRAVRESGHDTTYRFEKRCAHLATIDLNSLVYKYESDLATLLDDNYSARIVFHLRKGPLDVFYDEFKQFKENYEKYQVEGMFSVDGAWNGNWAKGIIIFDDVMDNELDAWMNANTEEEKDAITYIDGHDFITVSLPSTLFRQLANHTQSQVTKYLWNDEIGSFYDYNCHIQEQSVYATVTCLWALWAGLATSEQANRMVPIALKMFEVEGGLVSGTEASRGVISLDRPNRQWDYPYGWAPHQILAWKGLFKYGFIKESQRVTYRWLYTITKSFVDFNGVIPEKFDIVGMTHKVKVEYGNEGLDFKMVVSEGFGWMNASFQIGLQGLTHQMKKALGALIRPDELSKILK